MLTTCLVFVAAVSLGACGLLSDEKGAPVYGCWCGKNQSQPCENPQSVDHWDYACMEHDLCYCDYSRDDPMCDQHLIDTLDYLSTEHGRLPEQMQAAVTYFSSPLHGHFFAEGFFTADDVAEWIRAAENDPCLSPLLEPSLSASVCRSCSLFHSWRRRLANQPVRSPLSD